MVSKSVALQGKGITSRAIAMFVNKASEYTSHITIKSEDKQANAKSLLGVFAIGINDSNSVEIAADGNDEEAAIDELSLFLSVGSKF